MFFTNSMSSFGARAPYAEQLLREVLELVHELVGRQLRRVDRAVEPEVAEHRVEVGVGRERAEVAQRARAAPIVSPLVAPTSSIRNASRFVSSRRPVMPKSISTVRPSGRTMRLPPCRSPWKTP